MFDATATGQFGPDPAAMQPTPTATPEHLGGPEPMAKTLSLNAGHKDNPIIVLVALVAIAFVLLHWVSK